MASKGSSNKGLYLIWGSGSAPCFKAMLVLEEKGLSGYSNKLISFDKKEHKTEEVLKLNPRGQVPVFKDGDVVINESGAICFYLEDKFNQGTKLLPTNAADRAQVLQRLFEASNLEKAFIKDIAFYFFTTPEDKRDKTVLEEKYEAARTELARWNGYLKETKGFIAGKEFTMADVFLFPFLAFCVRSKLGLSKYPELKTYYDTVASRPSVQAAWPPHWKGNEGKDMMSAI